VELSLCQDGLVAIKYVVGDATEVEGAGPHAIAHVCSDSGGWGKGFVLAISRRWPDPETAYRKWVRSGDGFSLGMVQLVHVGKDLSVANMVAQHGYVSAANPVAVRYDALDDCLRKLAGRLESGTTVQMPRIGCGLAGGRWEKVEPILEERLISTGFEVRVYDLLAVRDSPTTSSRRAPPQE
jgi:O-acetyl-ADP-ribose deacetylase (regulator of RNase III)